MPSILKSLKLLSDPTRIRILLLLECESLNVAELQEILGMGQSRISTQLSQLRQEGLVSSSRSGKNNVYAIEASKALMAVAPAAPSRTFSTKEKTKLVLTLMNSLVSLEKVTCRVDHGNPLPRRC